MFSSIAVQSVTPVAVHEARDSGKDQCDLFFKDILYLPENMAIVWSGCSRASVSLKQSCVLEYGPVINNSCSCFLSGFSPATGGSGVGSPACGGGDSSKMKRLYRTCRSWTAASCSAIRGQPVLSSVTANMDSRLQMRYSLEYDNYWFLPSGRLLIGYRLEHTVFP